jgi:hypothetical protein
MEYKSGAQRQFEADVNVRGMVMIIIIQMTVLTRDQNNITYCNTDG